MQNFIQISNLALWISNIDPKTNFFREEEFLRSGVVMPSFFDLFTKFDSASFLWICMGFYAVSFLGIVLVLGVSCFCRCEERSYGFLYKLSSQVVTVLLFISIFIASGLTVYYFTSYFSSSWENFDRIEKELKDKLDTLDLALSDSSHLEKFDINYTTPAELMLLYQQSAKSNEFFVSVDRFESRVFERYAPIILIGLVALTSLIGIVSSFKSLEKGFVCVGGSYFICFILLIVFSLTTLAVSLLVSDYCVETDNNSKLLIDFATYSNNSSQIVQNFIFCNDTESFSLFYDTIEELSEIKNETESKNDTKETDQIVLYTDDMIVKLTALVFCQETHQLYIDITASTCGNNLGHLLSITSLLIALPLFILLVLITFPYTYKRIFEIQTNHRHTLELTLDQSSLSSENDLFTFGSTKEKPNSRISTRSIGITYTLLSIIIWLTIIITGSILLTNAYTTTEIPR